MRSDNIIFKKVVNFGTVKNSIQFRTPHSNNEQDKNTNTNISKHDYSRHPKTYHLMQPCPSKRKKPTSS